MYRIYLKQAWQILKEDKVISIISIAGTALAITLIMVIILNQEIKTTNLAPEIHRDRMMYTKYTVEEGLSNNHYVNLNPLSLKNYKEHLSQLKTPEYKAFISRSQSRIYPEGSSKYLRSDVKYSNVDFWKIFHFSFLEGRAFTSEEFQSGVPVAVVSKSAARQLFQGESAMGKVITINKSHFRIIGIVEDVSSLFKDAYAQIWAPYTAKLDPDDLQGSLILLAKSSKDFKAIKAEVRQCEKQSNSLNKEVKISFSGPFSLQELMARGEGVSNTDFSKDPDLGKSFWQFYLTLAVLFLIPAINLSGFSLFKMIGRTPEIGIRKAFGAKKKTILWQVIFENLLTSIVGGIIGLLLSFVAVTLIKDRLFANSWDPVLGDNTIPITAFVSPAVFFYVFLVCVVLNFLSAGIPAWRASRLPIVESIRS